MNRNIIEFFKIPESIRIPKISGWSYKLSCYLDNKSILNEKIPANPLNTEKREEIITVSLTSYPARIPYVHLAIKSLMLQTVKPDRIVLWLANEQFPDKNLPTELLSLQKYGLEICWVDDLYGHKKYYYCLQTQKENEVIITYDDDIIYPKRSIERLMAKHIQFPACMVCERGQSLTNDCLDNPGRWKTISDIGVKEPSFSINPSPGGGCLIPYGAFWKDAQDEGKIRALAYKNDDLWYMFMCAQNGTQIIKTRKYHRTFVPINGSQTEQMAFENVMNNHNEVVMKELKKNYPVAWNRIYKDEK